MCCGSRTACSGSPPGDRAAFVCSSVNARKPHGWPCLFRGHDQSARCRRQEASTLFRMPTSLRFRFKLALGAHLSPSFGHQGAFPGRQAWSRGCLPSSGGSPPLPLLSGESGYLECQARFSRSGWRPEGLGCGEWRTVGRLGGETRNLGGGERVSPSAGDLRELPWVPLRGEDSRVRLLATPWTASYIAGRFFFFLFLNFT